MREITWLARGIRSHVIAWSRIDYRQQKSPVHKRITFQVHHPQATAHPPTPLLIRSRFLSMCIFNMHCEYSLNYSLIHKDNIFLHSLGLFLILTSDVAAGTVGRVESNDRESPRQHSPLAFWTTMYSN